MPTGWHHERGRHRVDVLSTSGLVRVVRVLTVVVTIPLETTRSTVISGDVHVRISGTLESAAGLTSIGIGVRLPLVLLMLLVLLVLLRLIARLETVLTTVLIAVLLSWNDSLLVADVAVLNALHVLVLPIVGRGAAVVSRASGGVVVFVGPRVTPTLPSFTVRGFSGVGQVGQLRIYDLASFFQNGDQFLRLSGVVRREISVRGAGALATSGSTDSMNVVLGIVRVIEIDHVFDILHVQATSSDVSGDEDHRLSVSELG